MLNLPQRGRQVLGVLLNRSEPSRCDPHVLKVNNSTSLRCTARFRPAPRRLGVITADMVAPSNHLHVRFAPDRYRDVATRRTVERCQLLTRAVQ
jgi:hypothetical protein